MLVAAVVWAAVLTISHQCAQFATRFQRVRTQLPTLSDDDSVEDRRGNKFALVNIICGMVVSCAPLYSILWGMADGCILPIPQRGAAPVLLYLYFSLYVLASAILILLGSSYSFALMYCVFSLSSVCGICLFWWPSWQFGIALIMLCVGVTQAAIHGHRIHWKILFRQVVTLGGIAAAITIVSVILSLHQIVYFGVMHCILLNTILALPLTKFPISGLLVFVISQALNVALDWRPPWEVPLDRPTLDVVPWFSNLGFSALGVWFYNQGWHKLHQRSPFSTITFASKKNVFTLMGRHALIVFVVVEAATLCLVVPMIFVVRATLLQ